MAVAEQVVTSAWTPPHTIAGFSGTTVEEASHIMLNWDLSTLTTEEFVMYRIYRKLVDEADYDILVDITDIATGQWVDETAGQTIQYEYMITQYKSVVGDVPLESDPSDIVSIALLTDAWFIVMNQQGAYHALEVNVTDETHNAVIQQEVFEPLAASRKRVVRGNVLGNEGTLTSLFDTSMVTMAREHFNHLQMNRGPHILKSPFGDVWFVEFDAPGFRYRTGGHLEVRIGWVEI